MCKLLRVLICILAAACLFGLSASADVPWRPFTQTEWQPSTSAPEALTPDIILIGDIPEAGTINKPVDLSITSDGLIYVLESGGRILVFDSDFEYKRQIPMLYKNGQQQPLKQPSGIYADDSGTVYIADTGNGRGLKIDKDGNILMEYTRPKISAYTADTYLPKKVISDSSGLAYVLCQGVYQGLLVYDQNGEFKSFFGSSSVQTTISMITDRMWRSIMSRKQKDRVAKYVPIEFSGIDIDSKDFIYTCSPFTNKHVEQIRKLNFYGDNVLPYKGRFGEQETVYHARRSIRTTFTAVHISDDNFIYALDSERKRIYCYDQDGNMLFTFGTGGNVAGAFENPLAIDTYKGYVYVLDGQKSSITRFDFTTYGSLIKQAVSLYIDGLYEEALTPWQKVLEMNSNYELAYSGIGETYLKSGDYVNALINFRRGYNRERESVAFAKYRSERIRQWIVPIVIAILLSVVGLCVLTGRRFTRKKPTDTYGREEGFVLTKYVKGAIFSPVVTYNEMKTVRYVNMRFTVVTLAALFLTQVLKRQFYGFRFNANNPDTLNFLIQLAATAVPFALFCLSNWTVCSIADGKGKMKEIATGLSFALVPYILFQLGGVILSNVLSLDEGIILTWFLTIGTAWSLMLAFQALRIIHQYSGVKTIVTALLTVFGILVILFLMVLLFALFRQVYSFICSIYSEIAYR